MKERRLQIIIMSFSSRARARDITFDQGAISFLKTAIFRHTISRYLVPGEYGEESKNAGMIYEGIKQLRGFTNNDVCSVLLSLSAGPSSLNIYSGSKQRFSVMF